METYKFFKYLEDKEGKDIPDIVEWKLNIDLYYEDKNLIKDKEVLEVLDKAYKWLYELLTDDLDNLKSFEPISKRYYDVIYGLSKDNILLAYNKKNSVNSIHWSNFHNKFKSYMSNYITDYKILIRIIHGYLVNTLQMRGTHSEAIPIA